ncbi:MAG TPA: type 2 isopentenyl-diphosphate Delta-isomerase [Anaerolineaceae bacterium]|nr:type 2 isopentenyl-diphosphate Delta-isomerase [Anaerolineaceae bacterium]
MMKKDALLPQRKDDHIRINLEQDVQSMISTGFEKIHLKHKALPELDFARIDTTLTLFNKQLAAPILISSMTGGTQSGAAFNHTLALAAEHCGIAMGVGSQRAAIENPERAESFNIRKFAPNALLFANLGAVQLNYGYGIDECKMAVDMLEADALYLHLNPLQEALQPEGNHNFSGLLPKIEAVCRSLPVPVLVKEVGWGIDLDIARKLLEVGVAGIDVAGAGGTSWAKVEMYRQPDPLRAPINQAFSDWGIPTAQNLLQLRELEGNPIIFASGGLQDGVDLAKALALGAKLGGFARKFLIAANSGESELINQIEMIKMQLKTAMFACGVGSLPGWNIRHLDVAGLL